MDREKQDPAFVPRPSVTKVACDGVPDSHIQGISVLSAALGTYDADRCLLPVDIVEPKTANFACTQAVDRQEKENRTCSKLDRLRTFGLGNDA